MTHETFYIYHKTFYIFADFYDFTFCFDFRIRTKNKKVKNFNKWNKHFLFWLGDSELKIKS